jgi:hypothetical protein
MTPMQLRPIQRCKRTIAAIGRAILQLGADRIACSRIHVLSTCHGRTARCYSGNGLSLVNAVTGRAGGGSVTDDPSDRRPRRSESVPSPARRCPGPYCY